MVAQSRQKGKVKNKEMKQSGTTQTTQTKEKKRTEEQQLKKEIVKMLDSITDIIRIKMIYGFVKALAEEQGGKENGV